MYMMNNSDAFSCMNFTQLFRSSFTTAVCPQSQSIAACIFSVLMCGLCVFLFSPAQEQP